MCIPVTGKQWRSSQNKCQHLERLVEDGWIWPEWEPCLGGRKTPLDEIYQGLSYFSKNNRV